MKDRRSKNWVILKQAANGQEADIIESILRANGIPVFRIYREAGEYLKIYMGMTSLFPTRQEDIKEKEKSKYG